jgi:hypothetical protein
MACNAMQQLTVHMHIVLASVYRLLGIRCWTSLWNTSGWRCCHIIIIANSLIRHTLLACTIYMYMYLIPLISKLLCSPLWIANSSKTVYIYIHVVYLYTSTCICMYSETSIARTSFIRNRTSWRPENTLPRMRRRRDRWSFVGVVTGRAMSYGLPGLALAKTDWPKYFSWTLLAMIILYRYRL